VEVLSHLLLSKSRQEARMTARKRRRVRWRAPLAVVVLGLAVSVAGEASAATVGATGIGGPDCGAVGVFADSSYTVPSGGGTVTAFSFDSTAANAGQNLDFLVLRPAGGNNYQVVGSTGSVTLAGTGVETFPAAVQAQAGDILGFWENNIDNCTHVGTGVVLGALTSDPPPGVTVILPALASGIDVNESATLVDFGLTKTSSGGGSSATAAVGAATQNQPLTYTLAYSNNSGGGTASPSTTVTDTLATGAQFMTASAGCTYSNSGPTAGTLNGQPTGGLVTCSAGTVADGGTGSFTVVVLPRSTGTNTDTALVASGSSPVSLVASESDLVAAATNSSCGTTPGGLVPGSITIHAGTSCLINGVTIGGMITVQSGGGLVLTNSVVGGGITSSGATTFTLCGNVVGGTVTASQSSGRAVVGSNIGDCGTSGYNTIGGSLTLTLNANGIEAFGNHIGSGLTATGNNGGAAGEVDIESNSMTGSLACTSNTPPPTDNGNANTASSKTGQCTTL
jgi:hypothetical protein